MNQIDFLMQLTNYDDFKYNLQIDTTWRPVWGHCALSISSEFRNDL